MDIARIALYNKPAVNALRSKQNGRHFADDIFKLIFFVWKLLYFYTELTENFTHGYSWQYANASID